ncbi:MAG: site-2 protease family protein [Pirellulales bacterium]
MKWSWKLGRFAAIDVFIHWTFLLLLAWIALIYLGSGAGVIGTVRGVLFVLAVFGCVVLHEFGHALTARRFGIETRDITLLPIGGVSNLERIPDDPKQELWVTLAGPAVNLAIMAVLAAGLWLFGGLSWLFAHPKEFARGSFLASLFWVNLVLLVFNLLPAFPMDGGRILRAVLARYLSYTRATEIAANLGQAMAILFGIAGIFTYNPILLLIAFFVYLGAGGEARMVQTRLSLEGVSVREAMLTRFRTLSPDDTLQAATQELLAGAQQDFPVVEDAKVLGMLRCEDLVKGLQDTAHALKVSDVMKTDCQTVDEGEKLERVLERMHEQACRSLPVLDHERLVGLVTLEKLGELMMIRAALSRGKSAKLADNLAHAA